MLKHVFFYTAIGLVLGMPFLAWAERLSVGVDVANIRSGPDSNETVIWKVEKYHPLEVVQKQGQWCLIKDFENDQGWVSCSLLDKTRSVIVKKENCNVRSGPGTNAEISFTVDRGVPFKVIEEKGDWLHVVHVDGDDGWIHKALVW